MCLFLFSKTFYDLNFYIYWSGMLLRECIIFLDARILFRCSLLNLIIPTTISLNKLHLIASINRPQNIHSKNTCRSTTPTDLISLYRIFLNKKIIDDIQIFLEM